MTDTARPTKIEVSALAKKLLQQDLAELTDREKRVLTELSAGRRISRNVNRLSDAEMSFGDRLADRVAAFGGSWTFIVLFLLTLFVWMGGNLLISRTGSEPFGPYPFIFLNLVLSMLAAIQAPIIMMAQNRQAEKDRTASNHDYEVNLKAELEIMLLHEKFDALTTRIMNAIGTPPAIASSDDNSKTPNLQGSGQ